MLNSIVQSRITTIVLGLVLIAYAVYDIYEELFDPSHEHILIIMGILLVISSLGHVNEGVYKIAQNVAPEKELKVFERISAFFTHSAVRIVLGLTILVAAAYGLYEDIEKIHSKSVSMGIGVFTMVLSIYKAYSGGERLMKGIERNSEASESAEHNLK